MLRPASVNDVHSRLNRTTVAGLVRPRDIQELCRAIQDAADRRVRVSVCGGRHAMGGQQFGAGTLLIDMTAMTRCFGFDHETGLIEMEAGADWPAVIAATHAAQPNEPRRWAIRQKQTGADALTLGGAIGSNIHGRGLKMRPFVDDVESMLLVDAEGKVHRCSRTENAELFSLVVSGYGLFGIVASVTLRLGPRLKLKRMVDVLDIDEAIPAVRRRAQNGCIYGDFQYAIDPTDSSFLRRGVCACYMPVTDDTAISDSAADLSRDNWIHLLKLAHTDKRRAFELYSSHYLNSHGRVYQSDTMQLSTYLPGYDQVLKEIPRKSKDESLIIGEMNVPPDDLPEFLDRARHALHETGVEDIYGTIRSILRDDVTFLPWARRDYACVIFNLRTSHDAAGIALSAETFRRLQDAAIALDGSFYLTYHRFATADQIEACYPRFREFLRLKESYDPDGRFTSDWHRHYDRLFNETACLAPR